MNILIALTNHELMLNENTNYQISLDNCGNCTANNISYQKQPLPDGLEYVDDFYTINGVRQEGALPDQIEIPEILSGDSVLIEAKIKLLDVTNQYNLPREPFSYFIRCNDELRQLNGFTNTTSLTVIGSEGGSILLSLLSQDQCVSAGEICTYEIDVCPFGDCVIKNGILTALLPSGMQFINDSVTIDGNKTTEDITKGIHLADFIPDSSSKPKPCIICFDALVDSPIAKEYTAQATATYQTITTEGVKEETAKPIKTQGGSEALERWLSSVRIFI